MQIPIYQKTEHWETSVGLSHAAVAFSALPRGESPVVARTRAVNFVFEGVERYELDGRIYVVRSGEFLIVDAGTSARAVMPTRGTTIGLCVSLPATPTERAVDVHPHEDLNPLAVRAFQFSGRSTEFAQILSQRARHLANGGDLGQEARAALIVRAVHEFSTLSGTIAVEMTKIEARKASTRQDILQRLHRVRDHMHANVAGPLPLDVLARIGGMSQFHLSRTFRAVTGLPPAAYHLKLRLNCAREDLIRGHTKIDEAAFRYGFSDASSFSRAFSRVHGAPPGWMLSKAGHE